MNRNVVVSRLAVMVVCLTAPAQFVNGNDVKVLSAQGDVFIHRGSRQFQAHARQLLRPGDAIETSPQGGASLMVGTSLVYMGPSTVVRRLPHGSSVWLERGDVRVANGMTTPLQLATRHAVATLEQGIFHLSVQSKCTRLASQVGGATARWQSDAVVQAGYQQPQWNTGGVESGEELTIPSGQQGAGQAPAAPRGSSQPSIDVENLQQQAADAARQPPGAGQAQTNQNQNLAQRSSSEEEDEQRRRPRVSQGQAPSSSSIASLTGFSASLGLTASAGLFTDAAQQTNEGQIDSFPPDGMADGGPFPGNIHLVTGESRYALSRVELTPDEENQIFPNGDPAYYSVGLGPVPTTQVSTDFLTASDAVPDAVAIPGFDAYVVRLSQYGLIDPALDPDQALQSNIGIAGLIGADPPSPVVTGATPLLDERSKLNDGATFAMGEFRLRPDGGTDNDAFELAVRRSDQDRLIVKDNGGNDANDLVTPNPDVGQFDDVADPRFLPAVPLVKVPQTGSFDSSGTRFSQLNQLRRAAATTILADQLHDFARRTGQTRFVVDGRIIDISGYKR
jgi:hypothetical protein